MSSEPSIAERIWREFEVGGVRGLRSLNRDEVAQLPGIGPVALGKLDAALAAQDIGWGEPV